MVIIVKLFFEGIDFLTDITPKGYNSFSSILALVLICAELSRTTILDISIYTVFKKCYIFFKKWNIFSKNERKK